MTLLYDINKSNLGIKIETKMPSRNQCALPVFGSPKFPLATMPKTSGGALQRLVSSVLVRFCIALAKIVFFRYCE